MENNDEENKENTEYTNESHNITERNPENTNKRFSHISKITNNTLNTNKTKTENMNIKSNGNKEEEDSVVSGDYGSINIKSGTSTNQKGRLRSYRFVLGKAVNS